VRVLLTRPDMDSRAVADVLAARGIEAVLAPLLSIAPVANAELDLDGAQAVLVTSANGARALADATPRRDLTVLAVGRGSADAARDAGFERVESADGDVAALAALARVRCDPAAGALVHVSGSVSAGDLAGVLGAAGFEVRRAVLYCATPATTLPEAARQALRAGWLDAALFYSPRTAATFAALVTDAGVEEACKSVDALCLSAAVADALFPLPFAAVKVATRPDQDALLTLLDSR